jgi:hypothetical protein
MVPVRSRADDPAPAATRGRSPAAEVRLESDLTTRPRIAGSARTPRRRSTHSGDGREVRPSAACRLGAQITNQFLHAHAREPRTCRQSRSPLRTTSSVSLAAGPELVGGRWLSTRDRVGSPSAAKVVAPAHSRRSTTIDDYRDHSESCQEQKNPPPHAGLLESAPLHNRVLCTPLPVHTPIRRTTTLARGCVIAPPVDLRGCRQPSAVATSIGPGSVAVRTAPK